MEDSPQAARYYVSIFDDSAIETIGRYGAGAPKPEGSVLTVSFTLEGQSFTALDGGPQFPFTEAVSVIVPCCTQEEVDHYWERLSAGGDAKAQRTMQAMLQMKKLDSAALKAARDGTDAASTGAEGGR